MNASDQVTFIGNLFILYLFLQRSFILNVITGQHLKFLVACLVTVKILKIGTPEIITIIVLQLEQLDFTVQYCVQKIQTE